MLLNLLNQPLFGHICPYLAIFDYVYLIRSYLPLFTMHTLIVSMCSDRALRLYISDIGLGLVGNMDTRNSL